MTFGTIRPTYKILVCVLYYNQVDPWIESQTFHKPDWHLAHTWDSSIFFYWTLNQRDSMQMIHCQHTVTRLCCSKDWFFVVFIFSNSLYKWLSWLSGGCRNRLLSRTTGYFSHMKESKVHVSNPQLFLVSGLNYSIVTTKYCLTCYHPVSLYIFICYTCITISTIHYINNTKTICHKLILSTKWALNIYLIMLYFCNKFYPPPPAIFPYHYLLKPTSSIYILQYNVIFIISPQA
jgi:hypothetical protein